LTTGIDTIDYFISSDLLETDEAQSHYTERLVRLKSLAVHYYRPTLTGPTITRANFGLSDDVHLYGCLQSLWKFHPEFDPLLAEILKRDPRGRLVLLRGHGRHWEQRLLQRFARSMGDDVQRVQFVPQQKYEHFLALTSL